MVTKVAYKNKRTTKAEQDEEEDFVLSSCDRDDFTDENDASSNDLESFDFNKDETFLEEIVKSSNKRKIYEDGDGINDDTEIGQTETNEEVLPKKKKKKKKLTAANMKPPTAEEMTRLRETENLFHSNLFRMQIEEMIKEVRPKKLERNRFKPWFEKLKELFLSIDDTKLTLLSDISSFYGIKNPLPRLPKEESKVVTGFQKPLSVSVVGSYTAGCCLGPMLSVDVNVVIPKKCLLKEDYLNARYHCKRALYLSRLASVLQKSELVDAEQGVNWTLRGGNPLMPQLVVHPEGKLNKVKVFISAVPQLESFKLSRFTPNKNNIRESWLSEGKLVDCRTPTPVYNMSVMKDLVQAANETVRKQALENNNNLRDAVALLRVWLRQRQLDLGASSFSGFLVSMLVVALLQTRRLNNLMSSYQIVRNVWLALSQSDWTKEGFNMCNTKTEENAPSLQDFHHHFDVVFVDITGYCNLAADVDRHTYIRVKQEADLAIKCLDNPDMNSFQALFMTPMPFLRQFDHIICVKKTRKIVSKLIGKECGESERTNHFVTSDTLFCRVVSGLLEQGLAERLDQLACRLPTVLTWSVTDKPALPEPTLLFGLRLNAHTAYSVVEKGPPANEPQADKFRQLWGSKCELRRFRDGTVCEAVVWAEPGAPLSERRLVTRQMALHLLSERLGLPLTTTHYLADQLDPLVVQTAWKPEGFKYGTGEEACHAVVQAFDRLSKQLRALPDLPLEVAGVAGVGEVARSTDVFPPLARTGRPQAKAGLQGTSCWLLTDKPGKAPDYIAPVEGVLQLGLSRKWPEDLEAVRRIRAAFNLHIAKALQSQFDIQTQTFSDHIDVFKDGFVFRIRIVYPREVVLLKESTTPDGKQCYRDTLESLQLEKFTSHLPKLTGALHGVQQQWPAFSVACRLAKRWLSAQLVDSWHLPAVAVELLVASLFLSPEPFRALLQPQPMFLRFLHLLARTNWQLEPIIVNFNGDLKRDELVEIEALFRSERASLPPLFVATPWDRSGSVWTRDAPLLPVLVRVAGLATQALTSLENTLLKEALLDECKVVFRPPMELYDAVIHLKPLLLPRLNQAIEFTTQNPLELKIPQERKKIPITDFDPAQCYLQELRDSYSDYALFFHDTYGGSAIGVLFKPPAFQKHDFKVSHVNCRKPVKEENKTVLELNFDAIIEDFYILGDGLVKTIDLSSKYSNNLFT